MKRTIATTILSFSAMALAQESCPCFTAQEYDRIVAQYPKIGCQVAAKDSETIGMAVSYLWDGRQPVGVVQAGVTVEQLEGHDVLGGFCGIGAKKDFPVENNDVKDYGDSEHSPEAFQACVNIVQAKCDSLCKSSFVDLGDNRRGCGHLPFEPVVEN